MKRAPTIHLALLGAVLVVIMWSGWRPFDRFTWWLEASPGLVGLAILLATYRRFLLSALHNRAIQKLEPARS